MAKVQPEQDQGATAAVEVRPIYHHGRSQTDTKTVVVAVGASVVLFVIGLILGYLLGHQTTDRDDRGMMNSSTRTMNSNPSRNRLPTQSTTN